MSSIVGTNCWARLCCLSSGHLSRRLALIDLILGRNEFPALRAAGGGGAVSACACGCVWSGGGGEDAAWERRERWGAAPC